jgi:hypothetical protein
MFVRAVAESFLASRKARLGREHHSRSLARDGQKGLGLVRPRGSGRRRSRACRQRRSPGTCRSRDRAQQSGSIAHRHAPRPVSRRMRCGPHSATARVLSRLWSDPYGLPVLSSATQRRESRQPSTGLTGRKSVMRSCAFAISDTPAMPFSLSSPVLTRASR